MNNIKPVNGHLIINPRVHSTFLPTEKGMFEEIGIVAARPWYKFWWPRRGDEVFFDSWLSSKYPTGEGDEYFYLVPFKDIRAIKKHEANPLPE